MEPTPSQGTESWNIKESQEQASERLTDLRIHNHSHFIFEKDKADEPYDFDKPDVILSTIELGRSVCSLEIEDATLSTSNTESLMDSGIFDKIFPTKVYS